MSAATISSRKKVVDLLIRKGAPMNDRNKRLETALHLAADHAMLDIIDLLASKLMVLRTDCELDFT